MKNKPHNVSGLTANENPSPYISPRELAERWRCSRTSAQRIAKQAGIGKLVLGNGKHASIRYVRVDIERYEQARQV